MSELAVRDHRGVKLARWVPSVSSADGEDQVENLGDFLGQAIARELVDSGVGSGHRLLSAGSILQLADEGDVVWGAGLNAKVSRPIPAAVTQLDYRAVRGPLTRLALTLAGARVPEVYGDPVLLLPDAFPETREWADAKCRDLVVVPNLNDLRLFEAKPNVVSPLEDPWTVVRAIAESKLVVGSSLHAIVVADSLGTPARFIQSPAENPWKYFDYLLGTGRQKALIATTIEHALELGGHDPLVADSAPLRSSFPHDLWGIVEPPPDSIDAEPIELFDRVEALLIEEFDDVRSPGRGGLPMAYSLLRLIGIPLIQARAHQVRHERIRPLADALKQMIGNDLEALNFAHTSSASIAELLANGESRRLHRVALLEQRSPSARMEVATEDTSSGSTEWVFEGVGLGPHALHNASTALPVLLYDSNETDLPTGVLNVAVDHPDYRWTLRLRPDHLPSAVRDFAFRFDWDDGTTRTKGARVRCRPGIRMPPTLWLSPAEWLRVKHDTSAQPQQSTARVESGAGNVRMSSYTEWMVGAATPELSVIVTTHDVAQWLDETLYTILRQDVAGMEVIVVDDHSTDDAQVVFDRYARDPRLVVVNALDRGGANARDVGVAASSGRFLIFADGDDLVPAGSYGALVQALQQSGSDLAVGNFHKFSPTAIWCPTERWEVFDHTQLGIRLRDHPSLLRGRAVWNKAFRRDFWEREGIEFPEVARSNDIVPMTRAYLGAHLIDVIERDVYLYRDRPGSTSMTSRSTSSEGLISYLNQELECLRLVRGEGDEEMLATLTSLIVGADGFHHLQRAALTSDDFDPAVEPLVRQLLTDLPDQIVLAQRPEAQATMRLITSGHRKQAAALARYSLAPTTGYGAVRLAEAWLDAVELTPPLGDGDDSTARWYSRRVRSSIRNAARLRPEGPLVGRWQRMLQRALEIQPAEALGPLELATLQFGAAATADSDAAAAIRMIADHEAVDDGAATIDDWLLLLSAHPSLTEEQVGLVWSRKIVAILDERLSSGELITQEEWTNVCSARRNSVRLHPSRVVRRAAPIVPVFEKFGLDGVLVQRVLSVEGVRVDRVEVRGARVRIDGTSPVDITKGPLALSVRTADGQHVATRPVRSSGLPDQGRWTSTVDLRVLPSNALCVAVVESFPGTDGWTVVPMFLPGGEADHSTVDGLVRISVRNSTVGDVRLELVGVPSVGHAARRAASRVAHALRWRVRRILKR